MECRITLTLAPDYAVFFTFAKQCSVESKAKIWPVTSFNHLPIYSIIAPLTPLKYHIFEHIMENAPIFHIFFQKYSKLYLNFS